MKNPLRRSRWETLESRLLLTVTFFETNQELGPNVPTFVAVGDLNGDGDLDAFFANGNPAGEDSNANTVWFNDGDGIFTDTGQRLGVGIQSQDVALADLDGDGDLDAFVGNAANVRDTTDHILLNDGTGKFVQGRQLTSSIQMVTSDVELGDLDGDGDIDVFRGGAAGRDASTAYRVLLNDGDGSFSQARFAATRRVLDVALADFDADGDLDAYLVIAKTLKLPEIVFENHPDEIWLNDGAGNFTDSGQRIGVGETLSVAVGDLDNDGDSDVVAYTSTDTDDIWLNDGTGEMTLSPSSLKLIRPPILADLDFDDDLDVVAANQAFLNDGSGTFPDSIVLFDEYTPLESAIGDFDGNDTLDIISGLVGPNRVLLQTTPAPIPGDANRDGHVNFQDFIILSQNFGKKDASLSPRDGDFNRDGMVTFADFIILSLNFNRKR